MPAACLVLAQLQPSLLYALEQSLLDPPPAEAWHEVGEHLALGGTRVGEDSTHTANPSNESPPGGSGSGPLRHMPQGGSPAHSGALAAPVPVESSP